MNVNKLASYRYYQRKDRPATGLLSEIGMLVMVNDAGEMFDVETMEPWAPGEAWELIEEYEAAAEKSSGGSSGSVC